MTDQTADGDPQRGAGAPPTGAEIEYIAAERLIFFSDALVAIAITLLALQLRAPDLPASATNRDLLQALWLPANQLEYLAFIISFVVIGAHWRAHHRLFRYVVRLDTPIITLNMIWMLMIVITPWATRLLSGSGGFGVRFTIYAVIQVLTLLSFLFMSRHIRRSEFLRHETPGPAPRDDDAVLLTVAAMFALSIPVAFVSEWAFALWVLSAPAGRIVRRATAARRPGPAGR